VVVPEECVAGATYACAVAPRERERMPDLALLHPLVVPDEPRQDGEPDAGAESEVRPRVAGDEVEHRAGIGVIAGAGKRRCCTSRRSCIRPGPAPWRADPRSPGWGESFGKGYGPGSLCEEYRMTSAPALRAGNHHEVGLTAHRKSEVSRNEPAPMYARCFGPSAGPRLAEMSRFQGLSAETSGTLERGPLANDGVVPASGALVLRPRGRSSPPSCSSCADERTGDRPSAGTEDEGECGKLSHLRIRTSVEPASTVLFYPLNRAISPFFPKSGAQNAELVADHHRSAISARLERISSGRDERCDDHVHDDPRAGGTC